MSLMVCSACSLYFLRTSSPRIGEEPSRQRARKACRNAPPAKGSSSSSIRPEPWLCHRELEMSKYSRSMVRLWGGLMTFPALSRSLIETGAGKSSRSLGLAV